MVLSGPGRKSAFVRWLTPLCLCNSLNLPPERHRTFAKSLHEGAEEARKLCNETRISRRGTTAAAAHTHTIKPIPKITTEGRGEILLWTGFVVISGRVNTTNRGGGGGSCFGFYCPRLKASTQAEWTDRQTDSRPLSKSRTLHESTTTNNETGGRQISRGRSKTMSVFRGKGARKESHLFRPIYLKN